VFDKIVKTKGLDCLKEVATVYSKIKDVPNQVFVKSKIRQDDVLDLIALVNNVN
jgi:hypothetical protein